MARQNKQKNTTMIPARLAIITNPVQYTEFAQKYPQPSQVPTRWVNNKNKGNKWNCKYAAWTDGRTDGQTDTAGRSKYICDTDRDLTLQKKSGQASK